MSAMFRLLLRFALLLTLLVALPIALIRAQPNNAAQLRAFLTSPDGCPAPCFMGIRPGVTTLDEAIAILEAHDWVETVEVDTSGRDSYLSVKWDQIAPRIIDRSSQAQLYSLDGGVRVMSIKTTYSIGTMYLLEGQSQETDSGASMLGIIVSAYYFDFGLQVYSYLECPVTQIKFVNAEMYISFGDFRGATGLSDINFAC